jgi:hypothetical protein
MSYLVIDFTGVAHIVLYHLCVSFAPVIFTFVARLLSTLITISINLLDFKFFSFWIIFDFRLILLHNPSAFSLFS